MITVTSPKDNHEPPAPRTGLRHPGLIAIIALAMAIVCQAQGATFAALTGYTIAAIAISSKGGRP